MAFRGKWEVLLPTLPDCPDGRNHGGGPTGRRGPGPGRYRLRGGSTSE
jgi:hypothetical protein